MLDSRIIGGCIDIVGVLAGWQIEPLHRMIFHELVDPLIRSTEDIRNQPPRQRDGMAAAVTESGDDDEIRVSTRLDHLSYQRGQRVGRSAGANIQRSDSTGCR